MRARVLRPEVTYTASFVRPAYEFVSRWVDLQHAMYRRFAPFGARPDEIRLESASGQAHEFQVSWMNFAIDAVVRYRLGNLEVWTRNADLIRSDTPRVTDLALAALAAAEEIAPEIAFQSQTAAFQCHGEVQQSSVSDILAMFVKGSPWAQPSGARFIVPVEDDVIATLEFLPSAAFPGPANAWASVTIEWPGALGIEDITTKTTEFVDTTLERLDVDLDWGD